MGQKILSRSSDGMCHSSKSGVFTGQWSGCLLSKHVGDKQMWNILLNYYQNRSKWIYYSFWHSLWINVYKNKMFVKWLKAWEWWQGDLWPQVATKNYWTEGEPLAPRSYQLMIALVLSSPKTQNSFQPSRPEIDINNGQHPCIKYKKKSPAKDPLKNVAFNNLACHRNKLRQERCWSGGCKRQFCNFPNDPLCCA